MRYRDFIKEAIPNRPVNLPLYLKNRIHDLDRFLVLSSQADTTIKEASNSESEYLLRYAVKAVNSDLDWKAFYLLDVNLNTHYHLEDLKHNLESYLKYGPDFFKYIFGTLDHVRPIENEARQLFPVLYDRGLDLALEEYGYRTEEDKQDPDYQSAVKLIESCRTKAKLVEDIEKLQNNIRTKLSVIQDIQISSWSNKGYRPEHNEVETLYHATAFVTEILRDGFAAERPVERKGVGNFGSQEFISFTHEIETARVIMRSFKEIWMIVHGQLSAHQIWHWIDNEGLRDRVEKAWGGSKIELKSIKDVVALYRYWLSFTKLRSNPVLVNIGELIEMMKSRSLKDIGVISCDVRLDSSHSYHIGESEFRVPANSVIPGSLRQVL